MDESIVVEGEEDDLLPAPEPQVTSSDPNERKLARRLRIERRIEALRKQNIPEGEEEGEQVTEKTLVQKQLDKSWKILDKLITEAHEQVTNVRVAGESREVDRREAESIEREKLMEALDEEAKQAQQMFEDIAEKWIDIMKHHDPLEIHEEMESQKEKCEELLRQKDGIISMLREQIKVAERKFTNDQKLQNEDITTLASRIEKQIMNMRVAYKRELKYIDEMILYERKILIEMNNRKWEELYKKRDAEEKLQCEKKFEQQEEFTKEMDNIRKVHQEEYREAKIKLELDLEGLEKEFELIKTAAVMNGEKLDYNFQILKKREEENLILNSQQKRRINKLQDMANALRRKNQAYDERTRMEMARLSKEVKKLQKCVVEIESKAVSLSKINDKKFQEVWELNVSNANQMINRIMTIDKILHEQQMGVEWKKIDSLLLSRKQLVSYEKALTTMEGDSKVGLKSKLSRTASGSLSKAGESRKSVEPPKEPKAYDKLLRHILQQISDRSGFLLEKRMKELLAPYLENEKDLVKVDNVFAALGIKDQENIDQMCYYFLPYAKCTVCIKSTVPSIRPSEKFSSTAVNDVNSSESIIGTYIEPIHERIQNTVNQPEDVINNIVHDLVGIGDGSESSLSVKTESTADECMPPIVKSEQAEMQATVLGSRRSLHITKFACRFNHPLHVNPVHVIRALREFLAVYFKDVSGVKSLATRLSEKHDTLSRLITEEDIKLFWQKYKTFFTEGRLRLWEGLFIGLQKYYEILKDRRKLNDEVLCLRNQNMELQCLLARYNAKEMGKPPCAEQRQQPMTSLQLKPCKK